MICPKCSFDQPDERTECSRCGIVFSKYHARKNLPESLLASGHLPAVDKAGGTGAFLRDLLFYTDPESDIAHLIGRALLFLVIIVWGVKIISAPPGNDHTGASFMHLVNLPFHEAGHILFRFFGRFMMMLGGSLTQLLVPLVCLLTFLFKTRDTFAASVSLWWMGESLMDLAPYINDARELKLILLGGVTGRDVDDYHDWQFILRKLGWLEYDHFLANTAYVIGISMMICAFAWGGFLLFKHFRKLSST